MCGPLTSPSASFTTDPVPLVERRHLWYTSCEDDTVLVLPRSQNSRPSFPDDPTFTLPLSQRISPLWSPRCRVRVSWTTEVTQTGPQYSYDSNCCPRSRKVRKPVSNPHPPGSPHERSICCPHQSQGSFLGGEVSWTLPALVSGTHYT